ncbi:MAG: WD40 repeat domain-containing protein [Candidatus Zixiibacteriota bacterium]
MNNKLLFTFLSGLILLALCGCCDDCPQCPTEAEITDYGFYLIPAYTDGMIYKYSAAYKNIVDTIDHSVQTGEFIYGGAVSGTGNEILFSTEQGTLVLDIATLDTIASYDFYGQTEVSRTGKYIAVGGSIYGGWAVNILDGVSFALIAIDSVWNRNVEFSFDEKYVYIANNTSTIRIFDIAGDSLYDSITYIDEFGGEPNIYNVTANMSGDKLYFLASYGATSFIVGYDPAQDSTFLRWNIGPPAGDICLTPDGETIIATDPGSVVTDQFGSMQVIYIDAETGRVTNLVGPGYQTENPTEEPLYPGNIATTPDGAFTFIGAAAYGTWGLIDNRNHKLVDVRDNLELPVHPYYVSCQRRVK